MSTNERRIYCTITLKSGSVIKGSFEFIPTLDELKRLLNSTKFIDLFSDKGGNCIVLTDQIATIEFSEIIWR